jgi:hypothetical protein
MPLESLRLEDYSDREVLLVLMDVAADDVDGWAYAYDVGKRLGITEEHARRATANRLSWMVRYGAVEREHLRDIDGVYRYVNDDPDRPKYGQRWRVTDVGAALARGELRKRDEQALERLQDEHMIVLTRWMQQRAHRDGNATMAKLVDREWRRAELIRKG